MTKAPRRARARRGEGERLRAEILDAAERLLIEAGSAEAVSIRAIARACGCTPPSIYLHFADKDRLLLEACERRFQELGRYVEEAGPAPDDPLEALRLRGKAYVRFGVEHPEHYRLLITAHQPRGPGEPEPGSPAHVAFTPLAEAVRRCVDSGIFSEGPGAPPIATAVWALVHGVTSLLIAFPDLGSGDPEQLIDLALDAQIEGLLD